MNAKPYIHGEVSEEYQHVNEHKTLVTTPSQTVVATCNVVSSMDPFQPMPKPFNPNPFILA